MMTFLNFKEGVLTFFVQFSGLLNDVFLVGDLVFFKLKKGFVQVPLGNFHFVKANFQRQDVRF